MALGKGIPVINGFDLNSKLPLDSRAVADTMEEMNALVTNGSVGDGQLCYCKADKKMYVLKDNVWSEVGGGGGKSVPPTLSLIDMKTGEIRTSITEEEYNNLKNGLYNSVNYLTKTIYETSLQSKLFSNYNDISKSLDVLFSSITINATSETDISSTNIIYDLIIGQKDTNGNYPITIEKAHEIPFGSSGSNIDKLDIEFTFNGNTTLTSEQVSLINSHANQYVYVKFNEGIVGDNVYLGYVFSLGDLGTFISIVSQPNISGNIIIQSLIAIQGTTATHKENTIPFSTINSGKFLKTNAEGNPEWASIPTSTITITFED